MTDPYADTDIWPNPPASQQPPRPATLAASEPPRVAGEGSDAQDARVAAYAEAIRRIEHRRALLADVDWPDHVARAVVAVADAERNEAYARGYRAAREHWKARAESAEVEVERLGGNLSALLCDLTGGRLSKTTYDGRTMVQEIESYFEESNDAEAAEPARDAALAEVTELRDRLGRVEALADDEFATDDTADLPDEGVVFEQGAMWAFAEAGRLTSAALAVPVTGDTEDGGYDTATVRDALLRQSVPVKAADEDDDGYWIEGKPAHGWTCDCDDDASHQPTREWVPNESESDPIFASQLFLYSEWLDGQGLIVGDVPDGDREVDKRTHEDLVREFLAEQRDSTGDTEDASPAAEETTEDCGRRVGSKPWWMGSDQYDPCRCLLPKGHDGECKCSHTVEDMGAASPTEQATEGGA